MARIAVCCDRSHFDFLAKSTDSFEPFFDFAMLHVSIPEMNKFPLFPTRLHILARLNEKQMDDLSCLNDEKSFLHEQMEILAEKYEDTKDRQEVILKRY